MIAFTFVTPVQVRANCGQLLFFLAFVVVILLRLLLLELLQILLQATLVPATVAHAHLVSSQSSPSLPPLPIPGSLSL